MSLVDGDGGITLVTQYYPPERGAAQVRLGSIVADLVARGHEVDVVTALPNYPLGRIFDGWRHRPVQSRREQGAVVRRVWVWAAMGSGVSRMVNYGSFGVMSLLGLAGARRSRWVVVEYPTLFGALPAVLVARARRQKVAVIVADLWIDSIVEMATLPDGRLIELLRRAERWMLRRADAVTAVTDGVREALVAKGVRQDHLAWLPNGADTELFRPAPPDAGVRRRLGLAEDEQLFLYAGTHGYVHGLDVVLDAAAQLADEPVRFVLVGDGSEKPALRERAARMGLRNVEFLDPVAPDEVARLLTCATAGLATVREGDVYRTIRSAKALPTMSSGRPVIYSGDDEGARLVGQIGSGVVTPPGDAAALAEAVRRLAADPQLCESMGEKGRSWVLDHASWHHLVGEWLERLDELDRASGRAPAGPGRGRR
jgi:glycosyltransferase involved in cell wall biosynthesis